MQYSYSNLRTFLRLGPWAVLLAVFFLFMHVAPAAAVVGGPSDGPEFVSNELLIKLDKKALPNVRENLGEDKGVATGIRAVDELTRSGKVKSFAKLTKPGKNSRADADLFSWYKVTLPGPANFQEAINALRADPNVLAVEPNYIATIQAVPNDPYYTSTSTWGQPYPDMWGMRKINLEPAWDLTTGTSSIVVADIDTGFDRNHPDLAGVAWTNPGEIPGNGLDDDANGYIDDYYGWDWVNNDNDPMDDHGHGTHTAGTIAAVGNNGLGVVGVNWRGKVMGLKFLSNGGSGTFENAVLAFQYAADKGARVSSNSWGCQCQSTIVADAVKYEHDRGMVIVVAAGNSSVDALDFSPASVERAITVAASDPNDSRASFSNIGEKLDVAAPGVDILSTRAAVNPMCTSSLTIGTSYCRVSGTSMATPHVSGLAALLLNRNPTLSNEEVRQIIRHGAIDLGVSGKDSEFGYGRIDGTNSVTLASNHVLAPIITTPRSRAEILTGDIPVYGSIPGSNFQSYEVEIGAGHTPSSWVLVASSTTQVINGLLATIPRAILGGGLTYIVRLTAKDLNGQVFQFAVYDVQTNIIVAQISSPQQEVVHGVNDIIGSAYINGDVGFGNYIIEWKEDTFTPIWSTSGVSLVSSGTQPIVNGLLGTWDTTEVWEGDYIIRLTVSAVTGDTAQASVFVFKQTPDTSPPTVSITSPADGAYVFGTITVTAAASDNWYTTKVEFYVDENLSYADTVAPYEFPWNTASSSDGGHTLQAKAYDGSGNVGTSTLINVIVDNTGSAKDTTPPTVSITNPVNGGLVKLKSTVMITATATDNVGVTRVEFFVNNAPICTDTAAPYSCAWSVPAGKNKTYTIQVKAYDAEGNVGSQTITVKT